MRTLRALVVAVIVLLLWPLDALGHGELKRALPPADSVLRRPPPHVMLTFTEPPTKDSKIEVLDGCQRDVVEQVILAKSTAHIYLRGGGQPGIWQVGYQVISKTDGHPEKGALHFAVRGKVDCDAETREPSPSPSLAAAGDDPDGGGSSRPLILVAVAGAIAVGIAALVRLTTART